MCNIMTMKALFGPAATPAQCVSLQDIYSAALKIATLITQALRLRPQTRPRHQAQRALVRTF